MSLSKKQIKNKTYYEKNKDRIIENVKARRADKIKQEKLAETRTTSAEISAETRNTSAEISAEISTEQGTQTDPMPKIVTLVRLKPKPSAEIGTQTDESSQNDETSKNNALIDCIRSFLKVGDRYISLHPSQTNPNGVPIFFYIKQIEDEKILIAYVNIRFLKCGDGKANFIPEWENIIGDTVIYNKDLFNLRPFKETECYKFHSYLEINESVREFYRIAKETK